MNSLRSPAVSCNMDELGISHETFVSRYGLSNRLIQRGRALGLDHCASPSVSFHSIFIALQSPSGIEHFIQA